MRVVTLAVLFTSLVAQAQAVPLRIALSARVTDGGAPLTGAHTLVVRLFDAATGGTAVWTETYTGHPVNDGVVSATLGSMTPLTSTLFDSGALFVEVTVDATTLSPRLQLVSAPFAIRAASADRLGTNVASDFAPSSHTHAYLPVGGMLTCSGTDKVTGLSTSGSVMCGPDTGSAFAGSGTANTAARSDHNHTGTYLPVGSTLVCPGTQKVIGLMTSGSVVCGADLDTDTNTTYSSGAGLTLAGTSFSVAFAGTGVAVTASRSDHNHGGTYLPIGVTLSCPGTQKVTGLGTNGSVSCGADADTVTALAGSGSAGTAARSDHGHSVSCPAGWLRHGFPANGGALCTLRDTAALTWSGAVRQCAAFGGSLCTYQELVTAMWAAPAETLVVNHWLGDRVGDNLVLRVNGTNVNDFDEQIDVGTNPTGTGQYCCKTVQDF
ncbi:MAG: hypothetical protein JNK82_45720 [Myxococcaceae bacterium]|nr:hypothetical protein [Myxococcaceae bacterium]